MYHFEVSRTALYRVRYVLACTWQYILVPSCTVTALPQCARCAQPANRDTGARHVAGGPLATWQGPWPWLTWLQWTRRLPRQRLGSGPWPALGQPQAERCRSSCQWLRNQACSESDRTRNLNTVTSLCVIYTSHGDPAFYHPCQWAATVGSRRPLSVLKSHFNLPTCSETRGISTL